ncbi:flagellar assembly peptidoglycan hydrolase FlgJ [Pusillimonas sp. DMV24BSW_D]|uniref:flagellar assembly peptidoglycan hydrolase FlgJ n=1 Tax=Neopusillimonas aestuarii TaxID=2716226 RepID=UPI00140C85D9|nr:flagellar assembly peptidoglycan hydrolase FlgJ [Pusillimonas sp. DMV24BSW_D]QIM49244.1 flagellar assembly peptidoglycan hydrolase FlgJ [Pusillimonas sp. DMV24BSW_D]
MTAMPYFLPRPDAGASAMDFSHLNRLGYTARHSNGQDPAAQKEIAKQFEALFLQQIMKQARAGDVGLEGLLESNQTRLAQSMADEQMASNLAETGTGLAQALLDQMRGISDVKTDPRLAADRGLQSFSIQGPAEARKEIADSISELLDMLASSPVVESGRRTGEALLSAIRGAPGHIEQFVTKMGDAARHAAQESGIPAKLILSQAALESGWGRREIKMEDGSNSYNLFGIKATGSWEGKVANIVTTEFIDGKPQKMVQAFRAYDSYAESFADYARLISQNDRYQAVLTAPNAETAAVKVHEAGYATDPKYAEKLISIMGYLDDRLDSFMVRGPSAGSRG